MLFSIKTLNGRFTWVILTFLIFLVGLTFYSQHSVQQSASNSLEYIRKNQLLTEKVNALTTSLEIIESKLNQYSTFLRSDLHDEIPLLVDQLVNQAVTLQADPDLQVTQTLSDAGNQLVDRANKLKVIINQYLGIMQDVKSRYPGMPILLTYLEPTNRKFSEAVEQALQEGELTEFNPSIVRRDQYRIMQLFQEARYAWAMQISWFRVFVANRMGAFGDPKITMQNNLVNRAMFASSVAQTLEKLDKYKKQGKLGLQQEESLAQMHEALIYYNQYLDQAVRIYSSSDWRADVTILRDSMQPAIDQFWKLLHQMEKGIAEINKIGISKSQGTAILLSRFIWMFTGIISLMLLVAYHVFQKKIRNPVLRLADNMQIIDTVEGNMPRPKGSLVEINRLIDAYCDMRQQLDNRQRRLQTILDNAAEGIITIDSNGCMENFNKAASQLFQYQSEEVIGKQFAMLFTGNMPPAILDRADRRLIKGGADAHDSKESETLGRRKDGSQFYLSLKYSEMHIAGQTLFTAIVDDISERRAAIEHLRHLAEHDSLTGLYNRQYFNDEMEREFAQARRHPESPFACIYIDLDNFKYINDTLGHLEGDRLLIAIANTLKSRTRKTDILARLGGDEFALLVHSVDKQQAYTVAENYRQAIIDFIFIAGGKPINTGCSIGVALYEANIEDKEGLLARADIACHMAKRNGRNQVHLFKNDDKNSIDTFYEEMGWAQRIRHALEHDDFMFACQPMLNLADETVYGHELLLRMRDPNSGQYLLPGAFLDSAERFGLMPEIDRWVIRHAFAWLNEQGNMAQNDLCYFINLSGKSVADMELPGFIKRTLEIDKVAPQRIVFEITEDVAIAEMEQAQHFLREVQQLGFRTALDDFGVGYNSFSYLRELSVDFVKIDGSFINSMHTDELHLAMVKAINDICHILGKKSVAEFVENDFALKLLKEVGVDYAQGYIIDTSTHDKLQTIQFHLA